MKTYVINAAADLNYPVPTLLGTTFSVNQQLPPGLTLSGLTGEITGTPTAITPLASYVITASNGTHSVTTTVQLAVSSGN